MRGRSAARYASRNQIVASMLGVWSGSASDTSAFSSAAQAATRPGSIQCDLVNTTARLASVASAGEILVTLTAPAAARLEALPHRSLELKGKSQLTEVVVYTATQS